MNVQEIVAGIDERQARTLAVRVSEGQIRAVELHWRSLVKAQYGIAVASFTIRDRQNLKHMLSGFEIPEALRLLEEAVRYWPSMRAEPYMAKLSPSPVFRDLFWMRDHVQAFLADRARRLEKQREFHERYAAPSPQLSEPVAERVVVPKEETPGTPKLGLLEMTLAARQKLREEKGKAVGFGVARVTL